jgi:multicomponent Na+:H+ antiporter subunit A
MILTIIALAALVILTPLLTRVAGRDSGWPLAVAYLGVAALFTPTAAEVLAGKTPEVSCPWIPTLGVDLALRADGIGVVFTYIALIIGAIVFVYSTRYLQPGRNTSFYWLMVIFTFSMVALVLSNDILMLFVCWELTSLASFFLIARSGSPGQAPALRTMFFTFIGGLSLLVATGVVIAVTGTTDLADAIGSPVWTGQPVVTTLVALLVGIAAMTKSAQFPFHPWLPDAMAAATPVSAYLHAAAVVKAGIFLMLRFSPTFHATPAWNGLLIVAGLVTACLGGWFALNQHDVKKLMAYSTVSQLGLITAVIGVGTEVAIAAATLHVIAHALFKSGLFMMVGVVDHLGGTRDLARIPKLMRTAPASFVVMIIGCASMAGIPPLIGFVSKEFLFTALGEAPGGAWTGWVALLVAVGASVLTFAYCAKTVWGSFIDGREPEPRRLHRGSGIMLTAAAVPILVSIPLSFVLFALDNPLDQAVRAAMPSAGEPVHLALWHGFNIELLASALIIAVGVVIIVRRSRVFAFFHRATLPFDGSDAIDGLNAGLRRLGKALAAFVRAPNSGPYLAMSLGGLSVLALCAIPAVFDGLPQVQRGLSRPVDIILLVLITVAVLVVCTSHSRLTTVVALSAVGILATVQILALGAPDVTLTQLLVEAMTIIVIMLVLQKLPRSFWRYPKRQQSPRLIFAILVGAAVTALTFVLNGRRERSELGRYYLDHAPEISGGENIVNTILVEFRALDTLGELTVLGMAGIAIIAVMSTVKDKFIDPPAENIPEPPRPPWVSIRPKGTTAYRAVHEAWPNVIPLQLTLKVLGPLLALTSLLIFWRGHQSPGGGFIAALVGSAVIGLAYLSTARDRTIGAPRAPLYLIGSGVGLAVVTGIIGLLFAGSFLQPMAAEFAGQHWSTSMLFDLGVYLAVLGLMLLSFNILGVSDSAATPAGDDVLTNGIIRRDVERTRERADELLYGELAGPMESIRGERPDSSRRTSEVPEDRKVRANSTHILRGNPPADGDPLAVGDSHTGGEEETS